MSIYLIDFVPVEAAAWLEPRIRDGSSIRIDGPQGSGKTTLLSALANTVDQLKPVAGLADHPGELECLRDRGHTLTLIMPVMAQRHQLSNITDILLRQAVGVVVADDPQPQTWSILPEIQLAGTAVWASSSERSRHLDADIYIRLGTKPRYQVELITDAGRPVYWISDDTIHFSPDG